MGELGPPDQLPHDYIIQTGPFTSLNELKNIKGIGKGKLAKLQEFAHIPIATQPAEKP